MDQEFTPNLTPREIFGRGSFGGTYFRPILANSCNPPRRFTQVHLEFPEEWWEGIPDELLTSERYEKKKNKYGVTVGTNLEYWEERNWINPQDPYGWVQWYCRYTLGRRTDDDARQIKRWLGVAGPKGRFKNQLLRRLVEAGKTHDDGTISPKISQTLQHWAYAVTPEDIRLFRDRMREHN